MTLRQKQSVFVRMIADLIIFAYDNGYELTFGPAYVSTRMGHSKRSLHYDRLAIDFNLFQNDRWLEDTEDHRPLGEFWESIGGFWGGRLDFDKDGRGDDGNHYSLEHGGRK